MIRAARLTLPALLALLAACASTPPAAPRIHQLAASAPAGASAPFASSLGLGPVQWPDYLGRRQFILRRDATGLEALDSERWAEPLEAGFTRVLRDDLSRRLAAPRLAAHPWQLNDAPAVQVPLNVIQFDTDSSGQTVLRASWRIIAADRKPLAAERTSEIRLRARDSSVPAAVAAQSAALGQLADEIRAALLALPH